MSDILNDLEIIEEKQKIPEKGKLNKIKKDNDKPEYYCGKCGEEAELKMKEAVVCRHCGHRILFKRKVGKTVYIAR